MWWLSGIFRDVTLLEVPADPLGDIFIQAGYQDGVGTVTVEAGASVRISCPELGLRDVPAGDPITLTSRRPFRNVLNRKETRPRGQENHRSALPAPGSDCSNEASDSATCDRGRIWQERTIYPPPTCPPGMRRRER